MTTAETPESMAGKAKWPARGTAIAAASVFCAVVLAIAPGLALSPDQPMRFTGFPGGPFFVEYVSANPIGRMHVGLCRGDALANLLAFSGYAVMREYYINDASAQVDVLARSAFLREVRNRDVQRLFWLQGARTRE
jgi:hypothetical protein